MKFKIQDVVVEFTTTGQFGEISFYKLRHKPSRITIEKRFEMRVVPGGEKKLLLDKLESLVKEFYETSNR